MINVFKINDIATFSRLEDKVMWDLRHRCHRPEKLGTVLTVGWWSWSFAVNFCACQHCALLHVGGHTWSSFVVIVCWLTAKRSAAATCARLVSRFYRNSFRSAIIITFFWCLINCVFCSHLSCHLNAASAPLYLWTLWRYINLIIIIIIIITTASMSFSTTGFVLILLCYNTVICLSLIHIWRCRRRG